MVQPGYMREMVLREEVFEASGWVSREREWSEGAHSAILEEKEQVTSQAE